MTDDQRPSPAEMEELLAAAATAPSLNNTQPWRCSLSGADVTVFVDAERGRCAFDPSWSAALLAVGAFVEALKMVARARGFEVTAAMHRWHSPADPVSTVRVGGRRAPSAQERDLERHVLSRATNRRSGAGDPVQPHELLALGRAAGPAHDVAAVVDAEARVAVADLLGEAAALLFATGPLGAETVAAWRFTRAQARRGRDGIDLATVELGAAQHAPLREYLEQPALRALHEAQRARSLGPLARQAGAVASIVGPASPEPSARVALGEALERVWVDAERMGLALQPWAPLTTFELQRGALDDVLGPRAARMRELFAALTATLKVGLEQAPLFAFRVFRAAPASARSLRLPPAAFATGLSAPARRRERSARPAAEPLLLGRAHPRTPPAGQDSDVVPDDDAEVQADRALAFVAWCRSLVAPAGAPLGYAGLWRAARAGGLWPCFLLHEHEDASGALLPSAIHRAAGQLGALAEVLEALHHEELLVDVVEGAEPPSLSAEHILQRAAAAPEPRSLVATSPSPPALLGALLGASALAAATDGDEVWITNGPHDVAAFERYVDGHVRLDVARALWAAGAAAAAQDLCWWSERPGTLEGVDGEEELRERLAAVSSALRAGPLGDLVAQVESDDREAVLAHLAEQVACERTRAAFLTAISPAEDALTGELRRLGSGGPDTRALIVAVRRVLALDEALAVALARSEAAIRAALHSPPLGRALVDEDLDAARDPALRRLVEDLLEVDITLVEDGYRVCPRAALG